ncbi:MAG: FAD:protein FMN transferase [Bifidobacteriaceae bacterium]|jgi:thiamine biosynthesis lipoprotein ApbE|nr:FAD:protein FMN transferase [Bifidobacteriaceae bacterium]
MVTPSLGRARAQFPATGTTVRLEFGGAVAAEPKAVAALVRAARELVERIEAELSRFRDDSDIVRLNRHPDQWVEVGPHTAAVLRAAADLRERTGGLFDPATPGRLIEVEIAAGSPSRARLGSARGSRLGSIVQPRGGRGEARTRGGMKDAQARSRPGELGNRGKPKDACTSGDPMGGRKRGGTPKAEAGRRTGDIGARDGSGEAQVRGSLASGIDLGGIGKGYAADAVLALVRARGVDSALVAVGASSVAVCGERPGGGPWRVALRSPGGGRDEALGVVELARGGLATSGLDEAGHHIVDPRTGLPADSGVLQATVLAEDGMVAEAYSTALMVGGVPAAATWPVDSVLVTAAAVVVSAGARDRFRPSLKARN